MQCDVTREYRINATRCLSGTFLWFFVSNTNKLLVQLVVMISVLWSVLMDERSEHVQVVVNV